MNTVLDRITLYLDGAKSISVNGFIAPIKHTISNFHVEWDALANLSVVNPEMEYPLSVFQSFIPIESVSVGECWEIEESGVMKLLQQLHHTPNLRMHIDYGDSHGLWGCLRACNDRYADIQFRIHAEFKLKDGWFTPSEFRGNIIIDRLEEDILHFNMYVPEGTVNFDVNWKKDKDASYSITAAGLCQQMELTAGMQENIKNIEYPLSITEKEANRILSKQFYKSERINWVQAEHAMELAETQCKLIHVISVDGPLADEACSESGKGLRAGVLSNDRVIDFLNEDFINIWVSNVELERTPRKKAYMAKRQKRESDQFNKNHPLAKFIMAGWKEHSPVDCLVIAPEGDVMGKLPLNDFFDECYKNKRKEEDAYLQFLKDSLDAKFPGFDENVSESLLTGSVVILNEDNPEQEVIHIYRTPRYGYQDYNVITIDTTAFKEGGRLTIDIKVGMAKAGGSFDLFDGDTELPTKGYPDGAIASAWDIPTGQKGKIEYQFEEGMVFKLGATGTWFSGAGNINAFHAKISVDAVETETM